MQTEGEGGKDNTFGKSQREKATLILLRFSRLRKKKEKKTSEKTLQGKKAYKESKNFESFLKLYLTVKL